MRIFTANFLFTLILVAIPLVSSATDVEFGLPDSLQDLDFWDAGGNFKGVAADESCPPDFELSVMPYSGMAGADDTYEVKLTLPSSGLPWGGGFVFRFPHNFGLSGIESVTYSDDYSGDDPRIKYVNVWDHKIAVRFSKGATPPAGTEVTLTISTIRNPTTAGQYQIVGVIFNRYYRVVSGPVLSEEFDILPASPIALYIRPDEPITLMAGTTQLFYATAVDAYGNEIDDLQLYWSLTAESDDIGVLSPGSLLATTVGTGKVVVSSGDLADTSGSITVIPGALDYFGFLEYPQAVQPGESFPSAVTIAAYDAFDNLKYDYDGAVYFTSSDAQAELYYNFENRYNFIASDSGRHSFDGSLFALFTSGAQTITVTDGQISTTSGAILVGGSQPASFNIEYDDSVVAGQPMAIHITDAVDSSGNPATALFGVVLIGDGASPAGYEAIINDVLVINGSGSANQYLFRTGTTVLNVIPGTDSVEIVTVVRPAKLGGLSLDIQPTQFAGHSFIGPASITASDLYGNIKTDFDASTSPVTFTINRGELNPDELDDSNDFIDGVADLTQTDIMFIGEAGQIQFYVSSGNVSSNWVNPYFNGIILNAVRTLPDTVRTGFKGQFAADLFNPGDQAPSFPISFELYFLSCTDNCTIYGSIDSLPAGDSTRISFLIEIADSLNLPENDTFVVVMQADYVFEGDTITTTVVYEKAITVLESIQLQYVENSLSMDTILSPSIIDSLSLQLIPPEDYEFDSPRLSVHLYIGDGGGDWIELYAMRRTSLYTNNVFTQTFDNLAIPDFRTLGWSSEGYRYLKIDGSLFDGSWYGIIPLEKFDSVMVLYPSEVEYVDGSLTPDTVMSNYPHRFEFEINLDGSPSYALDRYSSRFELYDNDTLAAMTFLKEGYTLTSGNNKITTSEIYIPDDFIGAELTPRLILFGNELYAPRTDTILFGDETIAVVEYSLEIPRLKIISADLVTVNPPYLNQGQLFSISVSTGNLSSVDADSISLSIQSEDGSEVFAQASGIYISAGDIFDRTFNLTAPDSSVASVIYKAVLSSPDAIILPPDDNMVGVQVQSPAKIDLTYELADVSGDFVEYGQVFTVKAQLNNLGEASAGPGQVTLITGGIDFGIPDSSSLTLDIGSTGIWQLTAPSQTITANLMLLITETPIDRNISQPAEVKTDSISIKINVGPTITDQLIGDVIVSPSPLIVPGSTYVMLGLEFLNKTSDSLSQIGLKSIILELTDQHGDIIPADQIVTPKSTGFTNKDSIITTPEFYGDRLRLNFGNFRLYPHITDTISFFARINPDIAVKGFGLRIDSRDIRAAYVTGPRVNQIVPVTGKFESNFSVLTNFIIVNGGLGKSLIVRNNPFNPELGDAEFAYYLNQNSDIEMNIYTLLGEKVYRQHYPAGSEGGSQGDNTIRWNGRNDEGRMVLNGVYVVIIEAKNSGEAYKLKLAVMK